MAAGFLSDPESRRIYLLTKAGILGFAVLLSWLLSRWLGNRAWLALAAFAVLLALSTVAMLALAGRDGREPGVTRNEAEEVLPDPGEGGPVVLPVEDFIDLHPFQPAEIPDVVREYLEAAWQAGFRRVRLIHGRGIGVQRERVRSVLARHPRVREYHDAPPEAGGWGATIALLAEGQEGNRTKSV